MKLANKIYSHRAIENHWREQWLTEKVYQPRLGPSEKGNGKREKIKKPFYNLMMFPYPSAEGLHVGNMYAFTGADVYGRFQRMKGKDVFEPIGLDGFGIHSENYAIKVGKHPSAQAKVSEKRFYDQLSRIGAGYAWDNRLETYDPQYYRWTQWLFVKMFKAGLAERKKSMVNWCPSCKTVLADEQVEAGVCERCKTEVTKKETEQWFFKITKYADRLLRNIDGTRNTFDKLSAGKKQETRSTSSVQARNNDLGAVGKDYDPVKHGLRWPEKIKTAQRNWIGRKEGINISYDIVDGRSRKTGETVTCFTTRPDTNFGATFVVVAPEHKLVEKIEDKEAKKVKEYVDKALRKTEQQRLVEGKKKTGVFTGIYAVNQLNSYEMPIYVADFVLKDVGTGAVVGVPGHDKRDFEFAHNFGLEIKRVVVASNGDKSKITKISQVQEDEGNMVNSEFLNGLDIHSATKKMMDHLVKKGWGKRVTSYHLRDWLISRQRYWGPPIPMIFCKDCGWQPVPEKDLPVKLPYVKDYQPIGEGKSPLQKAPKEWLEVKCPDCGKTARRETDVSDTFLDSSWYFLRYPSVNSKDEVFDRAMIKKWLPVDAYIGGAEHAVLHLLYARFVTMALKDWNLVDFEEPFPFLFSHGLIIKDGKKMSKSRGNVVVPDDYIDKYGADTLRMYLMFVGFYGQGGDFRDTGIAAMHRFLERVWGFYSDSNSKIGTKSTSGMARQVNQCIRDVTNRIKRFKYNTAISALMELANGWKEEGAVLSKDDAVKVLKLLAPLAPHMAEEIYQTFQNGKFKKGDSIHLTDWPEWDELALKEETAVIVVQVNGKVRSTLEVSSLMVDRREEIVKLAKEDEKVKKWTGGKKIKKEIFVPGKLVNLVVG